MVGRAALGSVCRAVLHHLHPPVHHHADQRQGVCHRDDRLAGPLAVAAERAQGQPALALLPGAHGAVRVRGLHFGDRGDRGPCPGDSTPRRRAWRRYRRAGGRFGDTAFKLTLRHVPSDPAGALPHLLDLAGVRDVQLGRRKDALADDADRRSHASPGRMDLGAAVGSRLAHDPRAGRAVATSAGAPVPVRRLSAGNAAPLERHDHRGAERHHGVAGRADCWTAAGRDGGRHPSPPGPRGRVADGGRGVHGRAACSDGALCLDGHLYQCRPGQRVPRLRPGDARYGPGGPRVGGHVAAALRRPQHEGGLRRQLELAVRVVPAQLYQRPVLRQDAGRPDGRGGGDRRARQRGGGQALPGQPLLPAAIPPDLVAESGLVHEHDAAVALA